jgi:anti-sigma regulatory factor (Ser/Thr protein kinase)
VTLQHFELDAGTGGRGLAGARGEVRQCLRSRGLEAAVVDDAVLAVGEALSNAIEHSGPFDSASVDVTVRLGDDWLSIVVADHGVWRDRPSRPDGGRGLGIMRAVMDDVRVEAGPEGTRVHLRKHLLRRGSPYRAASEV